MLIQRSAERPPYASVSVLLLRWEEDASVEPELLSLEAVLRDQYNYRTERWNIPTVANPSIKLGVQMASFLENASPDHLLIIYYAGHGYVGVDDQLYWARLVSLPPPAPRGDRPLTLTALPVVIPAMMPRG